MLNYNHLNAVETVQLDVFKPAKAHWVSSETSTTVMETQFAILQPYILSGLGFVYAGPSADVSLLIHLARWITVQVMRIQCHLLPAAQTDIQH